MKESLNGKIVRVGNTLTRIINKTGNQFTVSNGALINEEDILPAFEAGTTILDSNGMARVITETLIIADDASILKTDAGDLPIWGELSFKRILNFPVGKVEEKYGDDFIKYLALANIPYNAEVVDKILKENRINKTPLRELLSKNPNWDEETQSIIMEFKAPNYSQTAEARNVFDTICDTYRMEFPYDWRRLEYPLSFNSLTHISSDDSTNLKQQGYKIPANSKPSRAIRKYFETIGANRIKDFEKKYAELSDLLSTKDKSYKITISINPIDFLRMSEGVSWTSCHNLRKAGCYSNGVFSYMMDSTSVIVSILNPSDPEKTYLQNKIFRMMFFINEKGDILQSRLYPQTRIPDLEKRIGTVVQNIVASCIGREAPYEIYADDTECGSYVTSYGVHYRDYDCHDFGQIIYTTMPEDVPHFEIGHDSWCLVSGEVNHRSRYPTLCEYENNRTKTDIRWRCLNSGVTGTPDDYDWDKWKKNPENGLYYFVYYTCNDCGAIFFDKKSSFCPECRKNKEMVICKHCGAEVCDYMMIGDDAVCCDCIDEKYCLCMKCGEYHETDRSFYIDCEDKYMCESCYGEQDMYFSCEDCEEVHRIDDSYEVNGRYGTYRICSYCEERGDYYYCADCDGLFYGDDMIYIEGTGYVCDDCIEDNYTYCEMCEEYVPNDEIEHIDGYDICSCCFEEEIFVCSVCEERHLNRYSNYVDGEGIYVCDDCYNDEVEACEGCGENYLRRNITEIHDRFYCPDCIPEDETEDSNTVEEAEAIITRRV